MSVALPAAVDHYVTEHRLAQSIAHVLVDDAGHVAMAGGALTHFGFDQASVSWIVDMFTPWFDAAARHEDRVPVPFVELRDNTFANVHFVADGDLTWIVLIDCSNEAAIARLGQQRRLEPFVLDLRGDDELRAALLGSTLRSLDIGTFERTDVGDFLATGDLPAWFDSADRSLLDDGRLQPTTHGVLQYFLPEAEEAWLDRSDTPVQSFVWSEALTNGEVVHVQAIAMAVADGDVLLLRKLFESEIANSANVQRTNDQALMAADAERQLYNEGQRLKVTLESIAEAVLTTDASGRIEFMNPAAERLTGWSRSRATGQLSSEIVCLVDEVRDQPIGSPVAKALATGRPSRSEEEATLIGLNGMRSAVEDSAAPIFDADGALLGAVVVLRDVSRTRAIMHEAKHQAEHDPLTGLANRREFEQRVRHALSASQTTGERHAICYLDLNHFKAVNDSHGHPAGDAVLQQVATRLQSIVRSGDTLARVGGDEFCVLLERCNLDAAERVASELVAAIDDSPFTWKSHEHTLGVSIGIAEVGPESPSLLHVMTLADEACYVAKREPGSAVCRYDEALDATLLSSLPKGPTRGTQDQ